MHSILLAILQNRNEQSSGLACAKAMNCQQADSGVSYGGVVANATSIDIYCEIATGSNNRKFGHTTGLVAGQYVAAEVDPLKACRCAPIGAPSQLCSLGRFLTDQRVR